MNLSQLMGSMGIILLSSLGLHGQGNAPPDSTNSSGQRTEAAIGLEIDGLIVDETRSKAGRDFYDLFYTQWQAPPQARDFTIVIQEKPFRGRNTQVEIVVDDQVVFRTTLQPRYEVIEEYVGYGIQYTYRHLLEQARLRQQLGPGGMIEKF